MKISMNWLQSIINSSIPNATLYEQLTNLGLELESLEEMNGDTILTVKMPPNRGDTLSMQGVARELALVNDYVVSTQVAITAEISTETPITVELRANAACPYYTGCIIENIDMSIQTPEWMQTRLLHSGVQPISWVVDVTNYVMLEMGQPLHAYDLHTLQGDVVVRYAKPNEAVTLLDDKNYVLNDTHVVIADKQQVLALAGIMGGMHSSVTPSTTAIFLEGAYFSPLEVRKAVNHFHLHTESSHRFERGVDPTLAHKAVERATALFKEIGKVKVGQVVICSDKAYLPSPCTLSLRLNRINAILGITLSKQAINDYLIKLEMKVQENLEGFTVEIPSFRQDITQEIDVIEEIGRLYGVQNIPLTPPMIQFNFKKKSNIHAINQNIKHTFKAQGFAEIITYSFISAEILQLFHPSTPYLSLVNPISSEMGTMRVSLIPGLVQTLQYNSSRQQTRARLFEMGMCFAYPEATDVIQTVKLGALLHGNLLPPQWGEKNRSVDFFDLKNVLEACIPNQLEFRPFNTHFLHPAESCEIFFRNQSIGCLGKLHPRLLKNLGIEGNIYIFEIAVDSLQDFVNSKKQKYEVISKFPSIRRDIAVVVDRDLPVEHLKSALVDLQEPRLKAIEILDIYQGKGIPEGKKSVMLSVVLQHAERTLADTEAQNIFDAAIKALEIKYQATLR